MITVLTFIGTLLFLLMITIIVVRFMGKSALAQFTPHDLIAIFFIVSLAVSSIEVNGLLQSVIGIGLVIIVHILLSRLSLYNRLNPVMIGEPLILIKNGKVIKSSLKRSRFSLAELLASIRAKGYADITHIQYAILEPSGDISVLIKEVSAPLTPASLGYQTNDQGLPIAVIIEGKIQPRNLQLIHKDKEWLRTKLQAVGVKSLDEIFYAAVREEDHSLIVDDGKGCF